jgi:AAA domain
VTTPTAAVRRPTPAKPTPTANGAGDKPAASTDLPWSSPSEVSGFQGFCGFVFSQPGAGKTTLLTGATRAKDGGPLLIANFDVDVQSIRDLTGPEIQVWPGVKQKGKISGWPQIETFLRRCSAMVRSGTFPFKTFGLDSLNGLYGFALTHIQTTTNPRDPRMMFGQANDLVIGVIREWTAISRETGLNVIATCHIREVPEGEGDQAKRVLIRPDVTPGVVKVCYQAFPTAAYLEERFGGKRRLTLHNKLNVIAKVHQPQSGPQLDLEIDNPDLGLIVDHLRGVRPYPAAKKVAAGAK